MSVMKELLNSALALSQKDRGKLIAKLLESLEHETKETTAQLSPEWMDEIERRIERYERGETQAREWTEVKADLEAYLRRRQARRAKS